MQRCSVCNTMVDKMDEQCPVCGADSSRFVTEGEISRMKRDEFELFLQRRDSFFGPVGATPPATPAPAPTPGPEPVEGGDEPVAPGTDVTRVLFEAREGPEPGPGPASAPGPTAGAAEGSEDPLEQAEEAYQKGSEYMESARKWSAGGHRTQARDHYQRAYRYFERALKLNPSHDGARIGKNRCLGKMV